jgi:hypothetical protein
LAEVTKTVRAIGEAVSHLQNVEGITPEMVDLGDTLLEKGVL